MTGREQYQAERRELSRRRVPVEDALLDKQMVRAEWEQGHDEIGDPIRQPNIRLKVRLCEHRYDYGDGSSLWAVPAEDVAELDRMRGVELSTVDAGDLDREMKELKRLLRDKGMHAVQKVIRREGFRLGAWDDMLPPYADRGAGLHSYAHTKLVASDDFGYTADPMSEADDWEHEFRDDIAMIDGEKVVMNDPDPESVTAGRYSYDYTPESADYSTEIVTYPVEGNRWIDALVRLAPAVATPPSYEGIFKWWTANDPCAVQIIRRSPTALLVSGRYIGHMARPVRLEAVGDDPEVILRLYYYDENTYVTAVDSSEDRITQTGRPGINLAQSIDAGDGPVYADKFRCYVEAPPPGPRTARGFAYVS